MSLWGGFGPGESGAEWGETVVSILAVGCCLVLAIGKLKTAALSRRTQLWMAVVWVALFVGVSVLMRILTS